MTVLHHNTKANSVYIPIVYIYEYRSLYTVYGLKLLIINLLLVIIIDTNLIPYLSHVLLTSVALPLAATASATAANLIIH